MNKVETPYTDVVSDTAIPAKRDVKSLMQGVKALIKIGIVNSNLIPVIAGFWLAIYIYGLTFSEHVGTLIMTLIGSGLVIAGGAILNNWYDVDIDPKMSRTKSRPTVTGLFSLRAVLIAGIVTTVIGLGVLLLFTTVYAALFAFIGWFVYVVLYTMWTKRKYTLNTIVGCFSGAMPPLIGWYAIYPELHVVPVGLFLIMFIWQTPHFLALAMKKADEYKEAGVPMLPVVYGFNMTKRQIIVYVACLLPLPFLLSSLGTTFVVIATALNIGWFILAVTGLFIKDDLKWANRIFIYSLNYLVILFPMMIIVTLPIFN
ncbi:heme o synthase [Oceanobacillus alkalisoli]|uniref:heme o synthase n=1 Tax=Oceanobacillus alkalisoli TaxID=2925113 RepID=UPI003F6E8AB6